MYLFLTPARSRRGARTSKRRALGHYGAALLNGDASGVGLHASPSPQRVTYKFNRRIVQKALVWSVECADKLAVAPPPPMFGRLLFSSIDRRASARGSAGINSFISCIDRSSSRSRYNIPFKVLIPTLLSISIYLTIDSDRDTAFDSEPGLDLSRLRFWYFNAPAPKARWCMILRTDYERGEVINESSQ
ncbi:hypothetical protein EVAR_7170_1 [Eumeta japonica]|uniref:Uncharacterized protein n=1 Tax=Eumeta variegata TaxID=151549 RepID=A0A4C1U7R3_EUMVA|nr:hypothetical protein EVAR_7170_1 [Eumeta japonica]